MVCALSAAQKSAFDDFYCGAMDGDARCIRSALTDDFTFRGPVASFEDPDSFVQSLLGVGAKVTNSRLLVDEDRVAHLYQLDVSAPMQARIPMCDVLQFRDNYICAIELYADSRLFQPDGNAPAP